MPHSRRRPSRNSQRPQIFPIMRGETAAQIDDAFTRPALRLPHHGHTCSGIIGMADIMRLRADSSARIQGIVLGRRTRVYDLCVHASSAQTITSVWFRGLTDRDFRRTHDYQFVWWVISATPPVIAAGLLFKPLIEGPLASLSLGGGGIAGRQQRSDVADRAEGPAEARGGRHLPRRYPDRGQLADPRAAVSRILPVRCHYLRRAGPCTWTASPRRVCRSSCPSRR